MSYDPDPSRPGSVPPSGMYSTYQAWQPVPPTPPLPPRRSVLPFVVGLIVAAAILFGAGTVFGRLTASPDQLTANASAAPVRTVPPATAAPPAPSAGASAVPGATVTPAPSAEPGATPLPEGQLPNWSLLDEAYTTLRDNYVDQGALDPNILIQGAIRGMLDALGDRGHTGYLTEQEVKARDEDLSGSFVGVGIVLDDKDGPILIQRVLPNSPALEGGLVAGETITGVDGASIEGLAVDQVVPRVRGEAGTQVTLTIKALDGNSRDVTMTRRTINLPLVSWALVPGTTQAVIRLESFSSGASKAIIEAITAAKGAGASGIVFDLRGNPGGYVDEAVRTASQFLGSGTVYVSIDKTGKREVHDVLPGGLATDLPLVVLVDDQTASSAEIVTGAMQDAGRATVVGTKTYGTGTVVGTYYLSDGSAVIVGMERWLTPKGHAIWREGLTPDQAVALPTGAIYLTPDDFASLGADGVTAARDPQLRAAIDALSVAQKP